MPLNFNAPEWAEWRNVWRSPDSPGSGGRSFEQWLMDHIREDGDKRAAQILANQLGDGTLSQSDQPWVQLVAQTLPDQYEALGGDGQTMPLEQALLQTALPRLTQDLDADAQRREIADALAQTTLAGTAAANEQLARTRGGGFDGRTYLAQNPDVAAEYERQRISTPTLDLNTFAEQHYLQNGQREGRQPFYIQSAQLAQDFANANRVVAENTAAINQATTTQLGALSEATAAMQQNLTGNLAEKATALQQQIETLNANLNQLDETQRQALTEQIAAQQANLEQSITEQRTALEQQMNALGTAAGAQADAQRAALAQEIEKLNAAQAPVAAARTAAAQLQATAINAGLQRTQDQLTAQAAQKGYVGGSTAENAALARSTIGARQGAAQAMGAAEFDNARDTRDIAGREATGERSIADAYAAAVREIENQRATGNAALSAGLATGRQQLGDTKATGLATITGNTAVNRAGIGAYGANTTYGNVTTGADQQRSISDALAQGQYGITSGAAQQTQQAQQQGAAAKGTYYDNDWNRSLTSALVPGTIAGDTVNTLTGLDNYANSGLGRTLNTLDWWSTNTNAAPTPGAVAVQPNTTGNAISQAGTGLLGGAIQAGLGYANSQNWWQPTTVTSPTVTVPSNTSPSNWGITNTTGGGWFPS
jgi:hypothetical protein